MALIVKTQYVAPLVALIEANPKARDAEIVALANAPRPTGAVDRIETEPDAATLAAAVREAKDFSDLQVRLKPVTEDRPVMGPSIAQEIGLGVADEEMIRQLRGYVGASEKQVREGLATTLLTAFALTGDAKGELPERQARIIEEYTGVTPERAEQLRTAVAIDEEVRR